MFIDRDSSGDSNQPPEEASGNSFANEEPVKITLIGTRRAVDRMIGLMHRQNIVSGSDWSRPISIKNSNEVISVASRTIRID